MNAEKTSGTCRICGAERLRPYFSLGPDRFFRCRDCGLIQIFPLPQIQTGDDYLGYDLDRYRTFVRQFLVPQFRRGLRLIMEFKSGGRLLDVGCGTGEFLRLAQEAGFAVQGVEPSATAAEMAERSGEVFHGELADFHLQESVYDVITLWSVLEHVPAPFSFLGMLRQTLRDDGVVGLRIPTARGLLPLTALWLYRITAGRIRTPLAAVYQTDWHYKHFYYYSLRNLRVLLRESGFEILCVRRENSYDLESLKYRMAYLPQNPVTRLAYQAALWAILRLSNLFGRQDELVMIAKKASERSDRFSLLAPE